MGLGQECHTTQKMAQSLVDHGYSGISDSAKVYHFLQEIKSAKFEAEINVVQAPLEKYPNDFDSMVFYLGQMVTKKGLICNHCVLQRLEVSQSGLK